MTKEELQKELDAVQQERESLFAQRKPIDQKLKENYDKLQQLKNDLTKLELTEPMTFEAQVEYFLFEDGFVSGERYMARDKFWRDYCGDLGLYMSGYNIETQQSAFLIKLIKNNEDSLTNHIKQLHFLLPRLKANKNGIKVFGIFEHNLSAYGSYYFLVNEKAHEYTINRNDRLDTKFSTLAEALFYIQENLYYE